MPDSHKDREIELLSLELEREKHRDELALRRTEIEDRRSESRRASWQNPLLLAIAAGLLGLLSNTVVTWLSARSQRALEDNKAEAALILDALKTGDPDVAAENLKLLVDAGLVPNRQAGIRHYLDGRTKGEGARLPGSSSVNPSNFKSGRQGYIPEAIVIHVIDGSLAAMKEIYSQEGAYKSAHYGISKDGKTIQFVREEDVAFQAAFGGGTSSWSLLKPGVSPNLYTVGIEHEGKFGEPWSDEMYSASARLISEISRRWGIPLDRQHIVGHNEIDTRKSCPGTGVDLERLVSMAKQAAAVGGQPDTTKP